MLATRSSSRERSPCDEWRRHMIRRRHLIEDHGVAPEELLIPIPPLHCNETPAHRRYEGPV